MLIESFFSGENAAETTASNYSLPKKEYTGVNEKYSGVISDLIELLSKKWISYQRTKRYLINRKSI